MTSSSLTRDNCFHGESSQLIWDTPKISSDCPTINCSDISNIFFKVRFSPVFLMAWKLSEYFFPMNTDASNVQDINIHQITERLSMSRIESSGERFSIFRNRPFTLFRNDRDFRERSDSVAVPESISISMTNLLDTSFPVLVFDMSPDFPHLRRPLVVIVPFWGVWWASKRYGFSSYLLAAHVTSSEVLSDFQIWSSPGFQMQSRQVRSDPLHGISIPKFVIGLDFAVTLSSPAPSCVLFDIALTLLMEMIE